MYLCWMGEITNSQNGVKSGVPERVNISCSTCDTRHDLLKIIGNQSSVYAAGHNFISNAICAKTFQTGQSWIVCQWKHPSVFLLSQFLPSLWQPSSNTTLRIMYELMLCNEIHPYAITRLLLYFICVIKLPIKLFNGYVIMTKIGEDVQR